MAGSAFEDQTVDEIDVSSLSDEELQDIVDNDDRSTLVEKAQSEQSRRASDDGEPPATSDKLAGDKAFSVTSLNSPDDPVERAEAFGINPEGINPDLDAGQLQVQDYFDAVEES